MCDNDTMDDALEYRLRSGLSRRQFGALTLGAGLVAALPPVAGAAEVQETEVDIKTPDGTADAYFVHAVGAAHPAVLIWPDIFGLRPAFRQMGKRLARVRVCGPRRESLLPHAARPHRSGASGLQRPADPQRTHGPDAAR